MTARTVPTMPTWLSGQKITATLLNQITTYAVFWANRPMFRMEQSVTQSVATSTPTQITMDTSRWDTDSGRSGSTPYSYTIPAGMSGRWRFTWAVEWASNATGARVGALYRNGSPALGDTDDIAADSDLTTPLGTAEVAVNAGDVMSVWGSQSSGGALSTTVSSQFASFFEGELVSLANP